jgi:cobalamin biosynthetic protein CobC
MLLPRATVAIAPLTYGEYAPAFERAGHRIVPLDITWDVLPDDVTHAVVVNPNNPTADHLKSAKLLRWHTQLRARGGTLLVDEAFADAMPAASLATHTNQPGLVVLRSPGKFFGLAGVRAGFVLGVPPLVDALRDVLGAWTVSGPARHAVSAAFRDLDWQREMRAQLMADSARLTSLLQAQRFTLHGTPLFAWTADSRATALHQELALRGIWTRLFPASASVRFGLPGSAQEWKRFEQSLLESVRAIEASPQPPLAR